MPQAVFRRYPMHADAYTRAAVAEFAAEFKAFSLNSPVVNLIMAPSACW